MWKIAWALPARIQTTSFITLGSYCDKWVSHCCRYKDDCCFLWSGRIYQLLRRAYSFSNQGDERWTSTKLHGATVQKTAILCRGSLFNIKFVRFLYTRKNFPLVLSVVSLHVNQNPGLLYRVTSLKIHTHFIGNSRFG